MPFDVNEGSDDRGGGAKGLKDAFRRSVGAVVDAANREDIPKDPNQIMTGYAG